MTEYLCPRCNRPHHRIAHAVPDAPDTWRSFLARDWPEIVAGVALLLGTWYGIPLVLALVAKP